MTLVPPSQHTRIKICGITREPDLDAVVASGADAVGFVLYPRSARYVSPARAGELARRLPAFITPVLLFVNATNAEIAEACSHVPGATLQFHGDETPEQCTQAAQYQGLRYIRAARIPSPDSGQSFDLIKYGSNFQTAQSILVDAWVEGYGGGGKTFNWSLLPPSVNFPLVLSGGLDAANVSDGIRMLRLRCPHLAVDVSSGVECDGPDGKGIKSARKIMNFVAAVRRADAAEPISTHEHL